MKSTIIDLWNGNIAPCERCGIHDPEIKELIDLMKRNREKLNAALSVQQKEMLEKYFDCSEEYVLRMSEQAFCAGFSLAGKLMTESLSGGE